MLSSRGWDMFKSLKCLIKGHLYVDSRSEAGTKVCVRCRDRQPFEGLTPPKKAPQNPNGESAT